MSLRINKLPTNEGAPFDRTNTRFSFDIDVNQNQLINLKNSYLMLNVQANFTEADNVTNAVNAGTITLPRAYNFQLANFGDAVQEYYLPFDMIKNSSIVTKDNRLQLYYRDLNFYNYNIDNYTDDREKLNTNSYKHGRHSSISTGYESGNFTRPIHKIGNVLSVTSAQDFLIPLEKVLPFAKLNNLPYQFQGATLTFDVEDIVPLISEVFPEGVSIDEVDFNDLSAEGNVLRSSESYAGLDEIPFYVGQPVSVTYTQEGDPATLTYRQIVEIEWDGEDFDNQGNRFISVTISGNPIPVNESGDTGQIRLQYSQVMQPTVNANNPFTINTANLVVWRQTLPSNDDEFNKSFRYEKINLETFPRSATDVFEKKFNLPNNTVKFFIINRTNNQALESSDENLKQYRYYLNSVPTTDRDIIIQNRDPLHDDRILRYFGTEISTIRDQHYFFPELVMLNQPSNSIMLDVHQERVGGGQLENSTVYLFSISEQQINL